VSAILYNKKREVLIFVKQFRPGKEQIPEIFYTINKLSADMLKKD